jgi:hypothetical protein
MSLAEAREVMWLRNNHRPLGELMDEGYLNKARLEWAAMSAYDPSLKQAAQVILDSQEHPPQDSGTVNMRTDPETLSLRVPLDVGIAMEEARATLWPFRPFRDQPMGKLVEARQLTLKDLGYAIENAWHERVRRAASALMLIRLNQTLLEPSPSAGPVRVFSGGRSYPLKQQFKLTFMQGFLAGAAIIISLAFSLWIFVSQQASPPSMSISELLDPRAGAATLVLRVLIVVIFTAAIMWLTDAVFDRIMNVFDKRIGRYRQGQEGEDTVLEIVRQSLDGNWHLFQNLTLPGLKRTDIDMVLVGPHGVWVLEVKALTGEYRNIGDDWEFRVGRRWRFSRTNPSRQARRNAARLSNFLKADGIKQWVSAAVVWANQEGSIAVEDPTICVWSLDRLPDELGNLWGTTVSTITQSQIVDKLRRLCPDGDRLALASAGNQQWPPNNSLEQPLHEA